MADQEGVTTADTNTEAESTNEEVSTNTEGGSLLSPSDNVENSQLELNPDMANIMDSDGSLKENFWEHIGDDSLKGKTSWNKYKSVTAMMKSLDHFERLAGKKVIAPDDMDEEQRNEFYKTIGVPEKPEDYGIAPPEDFPEDVP